MRVVFLIRAGFTIAVAIASTKPMFPQPARRDVKELITPLFSSGAAKGLNNAGEAVGRVGTGFATQTRAVHWKTSSDSETINPLPGGEVNAAFGINDAGE